VTFCREEVALGLTDSRCGDCDSRTGSQDRDLLRPASLGCFIVPYPLLHVMIRFSELSLYTVVNYLTAQRPFQCSLGPHNH
jgi:hypothetical protein